MENDILSELPKAKSKHRRSRTFSKKGISGVSISINIKCENDNEEPHYASELELKKYYELYLKLNKLRSNKNATYYITEDELNKLHSNDDKVLIKLSIDSVSEEEVLKQDETAKLNNDSIIIDKHIAVNPDINNNEIIYDIYDYKKYPSFVIENDNGCLLCKGLINKAINSYELVNDGYTGRTINCKVNEKNVIVIVYLRKFPDYSYPVYVTLHDSFTIKKFINIYSNIIVNL